MFTHNFTKKIDEWDSMLWNFQEMSISVNTISGFWGGVDDDNLAWYVTKKLERANSFVLRTFS